MWLGCAVVKDVAEAGQKYDYIVCAHKAVNQTSVPPEIAPGVDMKRTVIVIIQNGVGNELPFRAAFPTATILSCVVRPSLPALLYHNATRLLARLLILFVRLGSALGNHNLVSLPIHSPKTCKSVCIPTKWVNNLLR